MNHHIPTLEERVALIEDYVLPTETADSGCDCETACYPEVTYPDQSEPVTGVIDEETEEAVVQALSTLAHIAATGNPSDAMTASQLLINFYQTSNPR